MMEHKMPISESKKKVAEVFEAMAFGKDRNSYDITTLKSVVDEYSEMLESRTIIFDAKKVRKHLEHMYTQR